MGIEFCKENNPLRFIPIVERRLPISCFIFNQLKFYEKASDDLEIFSYGTGEDTWILTKFYREDYDWVINISAPSQPPKQLDDIKEYLKSSGIIDWEQPFLFSSLENYVTKLVYDINVEDMGHMVMIAPSYLFYMEPSKALDLEISSQLPSNVEVKRLDVESGTEFIASNWKYCIDEDTHSMVRKCIQRFVSGGVFVDQKLVAGAVVPAFGQIGMLHTDPEHRRNGYASYVMRFIFKELAKEGLQPCLISEVENKSAVNFHRSLGLNQVGKINHIAKIKHLSFVKHQ